MDDIDSCAKESKKKNPEPEVEIVLPELTTRDIKDDPDAKENVTEVNTLIATNMYIINHQNIISRSLEQTNFHLSKFVSESFVYSSSDI